jgi:predicted porin
MNEKVCMARGKYATVISSRWSIPVVAVLLIGITLPISGQTSAPDSDKAALAARVRQLEETLAAVQAQLEAIKGSLGASSTQNQQAEASSAPQHAAPASAPGLTAPSVKAVDPEAVANLTRGETLPTDINKTHRFFERKPGKDLTFYTHAGELTAYGNLDVSFDVMTKGIRDLRDANGLPPVGNSGWLPDLSTNLSYIGIRGTQSTGMKGLDFVYQLETQIDISSTSGTSESNSSESNQVKGGLTSRNSYIGLGSPKFGALVFGKTDAPYKQSTARLNPFFAMIGDYQVIMGNTGGDNRVEFGTRLDHSLWYTSKRLNGFEANVLFSPGQNRSSTSDNIAAGESDCTGIDIPGSGGSLPYACNDGAFSDAVSASVSYTKEPLYLVAAYERHMKVNRQSDLTGLYANVPTAYYNADVADEDAAKLGAQYTFARKTTVSAIYEMLHRYVPDFLEFQNERQRSGSWLALTQVISADDSISMGWARAYRTPGNPGQHNTSLELPPLGTPGDATGGRCKDNSANMYTVAYRHRLAGGLTAYVDWAATFNGPYAHYDLGAGGRGVTADCHDASDATGGESSDPHCWAGGHLKGVSAGLDKRF